MSDEETVLEPCPFCGGKPDYLSRAHMFAATTYYIICWPCGIKTLEDPRPSKPIESWNTRKGDTPS